MRSRLLLATLLAFSASSVAFAQEVPYSQTLDEQLERIKQGKPSVPQKGEAPAAADRKSFTPAAEAPVAAPMVYRDRKGEIIDSVGGDAIPSLPLSAIQAGDVKFITGGVGDEEMAQLRSVEQEYNLRALIASMSGEYLSELDISILDASGTQVAATNNAGPYFYANLKPGAYRMEITNSEGVKKAAKFNIPAQGFIKPVIRF